MWVRSVYRKAKQSMSETARVGASAAEGTCLAASAPPDPRGPTPVGTGLGDNLIDTWVYAEDYQGETSSDESTYDGEDYDSSPKPEAPLPTLVAVTGRDVGAGPASGEADPSSETRELGMILMTALTKAGVKIDDLIGHALADDRPSVRRELRTLSEGGGGGRPSGGDGPPSTDGERDPLRSHGDQGLVGRQGAGGASRAAALSGGEGEPEACEDCEIDSQPSSPELSPLSTRPPPVTRQAEAPTLDMVPPTGDAQRSGAVHGLRDAIRSSDLKVTATDPRVSPNNCELRLDKDYTIGMNLEEWPHREAPSIPVRPDERHVRHGPGAAELFPSGHSDPVIPVRRPLEVDSEAGSNAALPRKIPPRGKVEARKRDDSSPNFEAGKRGDSSPNFEDQKGDDSSPNFEVPRSTRLSQNATDREKHRPLAQTDQLSWPAPRGTAQPASRQGAQDCAPLAGRDEAPARGPSPLPQAPGTANSKMELVARLLIGLLEGAASAKPVTESAPLTNADRRPSSSDWPFDDPGRDQGRVAPCTETTCPCTASWNGRPGEHCCWDCWEGYPCEENRHQVPFTAVVERLPTSQAPTAKAPTAEVPPPVALVDRVENDITGQFPESRNRSVNCASASSHGNKENRRSGMNDSLESGSETGMSAANSLSSDHVEEVPVELRDASALGSALGLVNWSPKAVQYVMAKWSPDCDRWTSGADGVAIRELRKKHDALRRQVRLEKRLLKEWASAESRDELKASLVAKIKEMKMLVRLRDQCISSAMMSADDDVDEASDDDAVPASRTPVPPKRERARSAEGRPSPVVTCAVPMPAPANRWSMRDAAVSEDKRLGRYPKYHRKMGKWIPSWESYSEWCHYSGRYDEDEVQQQRMAAMVAAGGPRTRSRDAVTPAPVKSHDARSTDGRPATRRCDDAPASRASAGESDDARGLELDALAEELEALQREKIRAQREIASLRQEQAIREARAADGRFGSHDYERRPKAVLDLSGIELGMKPAAYSAAKSDLMRVLNHNVGRCGWTEADCITHLTRQLPRSFKIAVGKMTTLTQLTAFLDQQFLPQTTDVEEDEWDAMRIGDLPVVQFMTEIEAMADRLDKHDDEIRRCFVKGFKDDYPEVWKKMRTDYKDLPLARMMAEVKEWIELTRAEKPGIGRRTARVNAVTAAQDGTPDSADDSEPRRDQRVAFAGAGESAEINNGLFKAIKAELIGAVTPLTGVVKDLSSTMTSLVPLLKAAGAAVVEGPSVQTAQLEPPARPHQELPPRPLPAGWLSGRVDRVGPKAGYARVELMMEGDRFPTKAHVLNSSAPEPLRLSLREGETVEVQVQRDQKGVRVAELRRPAAAARRM